MSFFSHLFKPPTLKDLRPDPPKQELEKMQHRFDDPALHVLLDGKLEVPTFQTEGGLSMVYQPVSGFSDAGITYGITSTVSEPGGSLLFFCGILVLIVAFRMNRLQKR
jgi:hypothetical protein